MFNLETYPLQDYLNHNFECTCNRIHSIPIRHIHIEDNALQLLPDLINEVKAKEPYLIFDLTTYELLGSRIDTILTNIKQNYQYYILPEVEPVPDETTLGKAFLHYNFTSDFIIAVGSGTINDICRFLSYKLQLPYMIIGTAPSMDGYASNVTPLIVDHMKTTYEAHTPYAILADTSILKDAPMKMVAAGIGDILGKYTCLCDWNLAHEITGEYHCDFIEAMVRSSLDTVVKHIDLAKKRDNSAIQSIMEALVLSGIAMSFAGNSRPASGSEHHLSHYWEMMFLFEGKKPILHGTKVGIATIAVIKAYELLAVEQIDFTHAKLLASTYDQAVWEKQMKAAYKEAASSVISLENTIKKNAPSTVINRISYLEQNWDKVIEHIHKLPASHTIRELLGRMDAPTTLTSIGIDKTTFINSFFAAKELRNRFGLLQILFDLGLTEPIAEQVWTYMA